MPLIALNRRLFIPGAAPFPVLYESLRRALAETLRAFRPLAGELAYSPSSGTVIVVCRAEEEEDYAGGVAFAETDVEFKALAGAEELDADVRDELSAPAPVLGVQVTEFVCGGVAVGLALHHAATDGNSRIQFMQAWSASVACAVENPKAALHNWSLIRIDDAQEFARKLLRQVVRTCPGYVVIHELKSFSSSSVVCPHDASTGVLPGGSSCRPGSRRRRPHHP
uniref:Uncharacterized protein n=1 Tax=Oryza meridionalis TaxID=40149 RepID=A0A0E0DI78_9ORYZ